MHQFWKKTTPNCFTKSFWYNNNNNLSFINLNWHDAVRCQAIVWQVIRGVKFRCTTLRRPFALFNQRHHSGEWKTSWVDFKRGTVITSADRFVIHLYRPTIIIKLLESTNGPRPKPIVSKKIIDLMNIAIHNKIHSSSIN